MINPRNILRSKLDTLGNSVNQQAAAFSNGLQSTANSSIRVVQDEFESLAGDVQNAVSQVEDTVSGSLLNKIPKFLSGAANFASNPLSALKDLGTTVVNEFTELVALAPTIVGQLFDGLYGSSGRPSGPGIRLTNPLENYASYNAIFTIGCLSDNQVAAPSQYRSNGAAKTILRSGGGGLANRIQNAYEYRSGRRVEYFIDDVEIQSLVAPSKNTGVATGHKIEFKVIEPYSIGQWLLAMQGAAKSQQYNNYTDANYLLTVEFVGWDKDGNDLKVPNTTKHIPFRLINVEFNLDQGGTIYTVEAIPTNDHAFSDEVQRIPSESNFTGPSVAAALATSENSLISAINQRQQDIENSTNIDRSDLYLISFPNGRESRTDAPATSVGGSATVDVDNPGIQSGDEIFTNAVQEEFRDWFSGITGGVSDVDDARAARSRGEEVLSQSTANSQADQLFDSLNIQSLNEMNAIGRSKIITDFNSSGDNPFAHAGFTYNEESGIYSRNNIELTISDTDRQFKFPQNMTIQEIIEEMVLISDYGREAMRLINEDGLVPWFKVEAEVYPVNAPQAEAILGRKPRIFVYKVVPYEVSSDKFSTPDNPTPGTRNLKNQAVKEYEYLYTGLNRDILSLDLEFKAAFYDMLNGSLGNSNRGTNTGGSDNTTAITETPATMGNPTGSATDGVKAWFGTGPVQGAGGTYDSNVAEQIARQFHASILDGVDMLQAEMEIWGDPYYLPDTGVGNYTAGAGPSINITADGSVDYQYSQVHVNLNIRSPVDYNESTGLMVFQEDLISDLQSFGGIYQVLEVISKFSNGKFTQELKMLRVRNQGTEGTHNEEVVTQENPNPTTQMGRTNNGVAGMVGTPGGAASNGAGAASAGPDDGLRGNGGANGSGPASAQELGSGGGVAAPTPGAPSSGAEGPTQVIRTPGGRTTTVAKLYADNFQGLVDELEGDLGYEIRSIGGLVKRNSRGSSRPSWHAAGLAIDINPAQNPFGQQYITDMPANGTGSLMVALAAKYGLGWGGNWNSVKDAMHFSAARNEQGTYTGPRDGRVPPDSA